MISSHIIPYVERGEPGYTLLLTAVNQGSETICHLLLERTDIDIRAKPRYPRESAFKIAAQKGLDEIMRRLIEHKNFDFSNFGQESMDDLCMSGYDEDHSIVKLLKSKMESEGIHYKWVGVPSVGG